MKISELPTPYRQLAKYHRKLIGGIEDIEDCNELFYSFAWDKSPEGDAFWGVIHDAQSIDELPDIPAESYSVLNEIAKTDKEVHNWLVNWLVENSRLSIPSSEMHFDMLSGQDDNVQTFKMALECVRDAEDPESLWDDLELVYNIAAIIATKGDITMKQLRNLQDE